jgi:hypothetical protein
MHMIIVEHNAFILAQLLPAFCEQFRGRYSFVAKQAVCRQRSCIARMPIVANQHCTSTPPEHQAGA